MSQAAAQQQPASDQGSVELVNLLWQLKRDYQKHFLKHISLNMLIKNLEYREALLTEAEASNITEINPVITKIRKIEAQQRRLGAKAKNVAPASLALVADDSQVKERKSSQFWLWLTVSLIGLFVVVFFTIQFTIYNDIDSARTGQLSINSTSPDAVAEQPLSAAPSPVVLPVAMPDIVLRVHGSNTIGERLAPALLEKYLQQKGASKTMLVNTDVDVERSIQAVLPERQLPIAVELHAHGSSTAFKALQAGLTDIGMSSRPIKASEIEYLAQIYGDTSINDGEYILGLDGLAIIAHPNNSVNSLTTQQLARIFSGAIQDWSEVGGQAGPISVYARDNNSGTWDTFKSLVLKPNAVALTESAQRYESSSVLSDTVASDPGAIGFIGLPYVRQAKLLSIAQTADTLSLMPTAFTISTEDYPLSRRLYLYKPIVGNNYANEFIEFALSAAGQDIIEQIGLVSQNIKTEKPTINPSHPADYIAKTNNAQRLSVNFRFKSGSNQLDTKALRDLNRLVEYMRLNPAQSILLFGFTDDLGAPEVNLRLSFERAQAVADILASRGLYARDIHGFGEAIPLASNATVYGRNKNRRVEVWVE